METNEDKITYAMKEHNLRSLFLSNVDFVHASVIGFGPRAKLQSCHVDRRWSGEGSAGANGREASSCEG